jgi:hypothetical protein
MNTITISHAVTTPTVKHVVMENAYGGFRTSSMTTALLDIVQME